MGKRKPAGRSKSLAEAITQNTSSSKYVTDETFADSEEDFFAGRDKILLEEGPVQKKRRKLDEEERFLQPSDEEVLQYEDSDPDDASDISDEQASEAPVSQEQVEDETHGWGASKADYYDADIIETEADALEEEAEARRLQQKQVQSMTDADFGFNETQWNEAEEEDVDSRTIVEKLPDVHISEDTPATERVKILRGRYPEFTPLAKDYADLQIMYQDLQLASEAALVKMKHQSRPDTRRSEPMPPAVTRCRALSAYLGAIAMYFCLLSSPQQGREGQISAMSAAELREHPVMVMLVECRQLWERARLLEDADNDGLDEDHTNGESVPIGEEMLATISDKRSKVAKRKDISSQAKAINKKPITISVPKQKIDTQSETTTKADKRKKRQRQSDLETLLAHTQVPTEADGHSDFGDEVPLTAQEAAEKARRKKSLRFYSSQIVQKSNKRGAASRDAGGDDDLPRKERLRDRQARLLEQAERRGRQAPDLDEQLDGEEPEAVHGEDEYYDLVAAKSKQRKSDKQARAEAYAEAARQGGEVYEEERIGADGKRAITYAIEKNKGLMPRRKKDVRNPRVKKRKKYDEKMKKLGSVRQVYKGGEGRGGYGGELTGIKTNLVKSVKL